MKRILLTIAIFAVFSSPVLAWDCTTKGQIRVQVPAGTKGNGPGNGDGQVDTVEGITFQCQNSPSTPPAPKNASVTNTNQNTNNNSNSNTNSNNNSAKSTSSATGGNASATGGSATQGQKQGQSQSANNTQSQSATANNAGNNSTYSSNSVTNVAAPKIPVETAYAPSIAPTVPCFKGFGGGIQTAPVGLSFGGGKIDENCAILEASRQAPSLRARCLVYISNKYVRDAGVTLADCLASSVTEQVVPVPVAQITPQPEPAPPVTTSTTVRVRDIGECKLINGKLSNGCKRTLDGAVLALQMNPDAKLIISGPVEAGQAVLYLRGKIDPSRIGQPTFSDEQNATLSFQLYWESVS